MTLLTPWSESLDPGAPLPDYPRPQLVRGDWRNLNGRWDYAITPLRLDQRAEPDPLAVADPGAPPNDWDGRIVVPFSPETALSGVGRTLRADQTLWYRRSFSLPRPLRGGERAILHFGAVDQSCRVAVDGTEVGGHTGGYLPFSFDVTAALTAGSQHDLVVAVRDVTVPPPSPRSAGAMRGASGRVGAASWPARGKQSSRPGGIWYTPQSGIWQTVWLEIVPRIAVDRLVLTPDLDAGAVVVTVHSDHAAGTDHAQVEVLDGDRVAASIALPAGVPTPISLDGPVKTWTPDEPFLYDVRVTLGDDRVRSYVGMRSFGVGVDDRGFPCLMLNGEPHLPVGLLDQGYWPDGGYTPASDAALEYDIRLAKRMGFSMLRKHLKIEPLRWYHHCDRLGMLVWQDAVSGGTEYNPLVVSAPAIASPTLDDRKHARFGRADAAGRAQFEIELHDMIEHLRSVPSISLWVPFNEGWGQFDAARIAAVVRELDPTRPVDHASGWHDQGAGDLRSLHIYFRPVKVPRRADARVLALTEYGGYSLAVPSHTWSSTSFGYKKYRSRDQLVAALERLHDREIAPAIERGLAATVYTQLADVEEEVNGLVTYDRRFVKVPEDVMRAINDRLREAASRRVPAEAGPIRKDHA